MTRIYVTSAFPSEAQAVLDAGLVGHDVLTPAHASSSNLVPGEADARIGTVDVVLGQPPVPALSLGPGPRWVHLTSAGYTRYAVPDVAASLRKRGITLTTSSSVYAEPCATHALALLLALVRMLPEARDDQRGPRAWPAAELRARARVLPGLSILVLGYGAIGRRLLELLAPFRARLAVVREHPKGDEAVRALTRARAMDELGGFDAVISTLPETDATRAFVDEAWLRAMKRGALFINIGRGVTVDQDALVRAVRDDHLGGVALDVTEPEPLPPDHPLWTLPRVLVTPHAAGGRVEEHVELVRHFLANLERFTRGEPLVDRVL